MSHNVIPRNIIWYSMIQDNVIQDDINKYKIEQMA